MARLATPEGRTIDQIHLLIDGLLGNPHSRRHIVSAWNVGQIHQMALPPCHLLFQFYVHEARGRRPPGLSCQLYQRSADLFLGVPFMSALLSANEIRLTYGYQTLLDGVTLAVAAGRENRHGRPQRLRQDLAAENPQRRAGPGFRRDRAAARAARRLPAAGIRTRWELSVQENIAAGAADIVEAMRRYENGEGSEAELADLLHLIDHADGWNLEPGSRPPPPRSARRRSMPRSARFPAAKNAGSPCAARWPASRTCCCWTSRPTTSTPSRSAGWRITCAASPAR
jgi:hypothetical protein